MSTSKEAWELAWREEFPNAARVVHYDGIAAAKRCGFEGWLPSGRQTLTRSCRFRSQYW
jgi:hypothetical protein